MGWTRLGLDARLTEHFTISEAACKCCGRVVDDLDILKNTAQMMEQIRAILGDKPVKVLSWCRCPKHNAAVGGAKDSFHMRGEAVDFVVRHLSPREVQEKLKAHAGGLGLYVGFTHADTGPRRRWTG